MDSRWLHNKRFACNNFSFCINLRAIYGFVFPIVCAKHYTGKRTYGTQPAKQIKRLPAVIAVVGSLLKIL